MLVLPDRLSHDEFIQAYGVIYQQITNDPKPDQPKGLRHIGIHVDGGRKVRSEWKSNFVMNVIAPEPDGLGFAGYCFPLNTRHELV